MDKCGKWTSASQHQSFGKQVTSDPLEKRLRRNTARSWWIAFDTMKEMEECLKELDCRVSRNRRNWATQYRAEVIKLELRRNLGLTWEKLLLEYFENEMRPP